MNEKETLACIQEAIANLPAADREIIAHHVTVMRNQLSHPNEGGRFATALALIGAELAAQ